MEQNKYELFHYNNRFLTSEEYNQDRNHYLLIHYKKLLKTMQHEFLPDNHSNIQQHQSLFSSAVFYHPISAFLQRQQPIKQSLLQIYPNTYLCNFQLPYHQADRKSLAHEDQDSPEYHPTNIVQQDYPYQQRNDGYNKYLSNQHLSHQKPNEDTYQQLSHHQDLSINQPLQTIRPDHQTNA